MPTALLAVGSAVLLLRDRVNSSALVAAGAAAGIMAGTAWPYALGGAALTIGALALLARPVLTRLAVI